MRPWQCTCTCRSASSVATEPSRRSSTERRSWKTNAVPRIPTPMIDEHDAHVTQDRQRARGCLALEPCGSVWTTTATRRDRWPKLTEKQLEFLENPFVGVVTTLREDGSPHSTVVWVDVEDGIPTFNTATGPQEAGEPRERSARLAARHRPAGRLQVGRRRRQGGAHDRRRGSADRQAREEVPRQGRVPVPAGRRAARDGPDHTRSTSARAVSTARNGLQRGEDLLRRANALPLAPPSMKPWKSCEQCSPAKWMFPCGTPS